MNQIKNNKGVVTKIFANIFEQEAYDQIKNLINSEPYSENTVRIMPDAHAGKGCTVGTTMTIDDKLTPNLVGVDIGCGMLTVALDNKVIDFEMLDDIIHKFIPSGFSVNQTKSYFNFSDLRCKSHVDLERAELSIGSLGGGNHFIEVAKSEGTGDLYLIIHTGSRKLGGDVCKYYQNKAITSLLQKNDSRGKVIDRLKSEGREKDISEELKKLRSPSINKDLAYLEGKDFGDYLNDMKIVQKFASINRWTIANTIIRMAGLEEKSRFETVHNYIDFNRMILRKGAVSAELGETLLIPINMRDGSLLCKGKGNEDWNYSAPHGAGRLMSRSKAKLSIDLIEFEKSMAGVHSSSVGKSTLDEAPQAYKPMNEIKDSIQDSVEVLDVLRPLYNFKAH